MRALAAPPQCYTEELTLPNGTVVYNFHDCGRKACPASTNK